MEGILSLEGGLTHNKTIEKLDISENGIGDQGCAVIGRVLRENMHLKELNVSSKNEKQLPNSRTVKTGNDINQEGWDTISDGLDGNRTLTSLSAMCKQRYLPSKTE